MAASSVPWCCGVVSPAAEDAAAVARDAAQAGAPRTARRAMAAAEHAVRKGTAEDAAFVMAMRDDLVASNGGHTT